ncbi:hypothetical protein COO91_11185 (plasmid) [Nostoc flagelliforme CCNUN1]|uniref:Uncharacterized protein n=1 Tax=Nostoc flagelliforme CCNUN1 TaxID=2038116 RepID=A0A2K8TB84_9NOSO|nr:hypothetical protein COO91_11185 [Nostoc flagelliforme CCNUN1]
MELFKVMMGCHFSGEWQPLVVMHLKYLSKSYSPHLLSLDEI